MNDIMGQQEGDGQMLKYKHKYNLLKIILLNIERFISTSIGMSVLLAHKQSLEIYHRNFTHLILITILIHFVIILRRFIFYLHCLCVLFFVFAALVRMVVLLRTVGLGGVDYVGLKGLVASGGVFFICFRFAAIIGFQKFKVLFLDIYEVIFFFLLLLFVLGIFVLVGYFGHELLQFQVDDDLSLEIFFQQLDLLFQLIFFQDFFVQFLNSHRQMSILMFELSYLLLIQLNPFFVIFVILPIPFLLHSAEETLREAQVVCPLYTNKPDAGVYLMNLLGCSLGSFKSISIFQNTHQSN